MQVPHSLQAVYRYPYDIAAMCALNPRFDQIFETLHNLKQTYPHMTPVQMLMEVMAMHPELDTEALVEGGFPLSFDEANALDDYFFQVGKTEMWRQAYGFPLTNTNFVKDCYAVNVGMFTFNLSRHPQ